MNLQGSGTDQVCVLGLLGLLGCTRALRFQQIPDTRRFPGPRTIYHPAWDVLVYMEVPGGIWHLLVPEAWRGWEPWGWYLGVTGAQIITLGEGGMRGDSDAISQAPRRPQTLPPIICICQCPIGTPLLSSSFFFSLPIPVGLLLPPLPSSIFSRLITTTLPEPPPHFPLPPDLP